MKLKRKLAVEVEVKKDVGGPLSQNAGEAKRELTNIRAREVSLVDAAANGRKFLIVKNKDGNQKDAKLFKNETEEGKNSDKQNTEKTPTEAATATAKPGEGQGQEAGVPEEIEEVVIDNHEFTEQAQSVLEEIPVAKALAMPQKDMFLAMSDALMSFGFGMDMIRADLMTFVQSDGKTGFMGEDVLKSLLKDNEGKDQKEINILVAKKGKKMKGARLEKLRGIQESISSLIKELEDGQTIEKGGFVVTTATEKGTEKKPGTETEAAKADAAKIAKDQEAAKAAADAAAKVAADAAAAAAPAPLTAKDLEVAVEKAVEKHIKPLQEKLDKLSDAPAKAAGEGAESTESTTVTKGADGKDVPVKKGKEFWGGIIR